MVSFKLSTICDLFLLTNDLMKLPKNYPVVLNCHCLKAKYIEESQVHRRNYFIEALNSLCVRISMLEVTFYSLRFHEKGDIGQYFVKKTMESKSFSLNRLISSTGYYNRILFLSSKKIGFRCYHHTIGDFADCKCFSRLTYKLLLYQNRQWLT